MAVSRGAATALAFAAALAPARCPFCVYGVEQKLKRLDGVEDLEVDLETGVATLTLAEDADLSNDVLRTVVDDAGFEVAAIERSFASEYADVEPPGGADER